ncbi:MAG: nitroreductase family protein [Thermodesulfobacteriota bacterium]
MDFKDVVARRRAVNYFDPGREVTDDQLRRIVELAARSPSGFNLQPWNLIILREMEAKERLRKVAWDQFKITQAPVVIIMLADRDGWKQGHPTFEKNFKSLVEVGQLKEEQYEWFSHTCQGLYGKSREDEIVFSGKNTCLFAMSLMYAAVDQGLDCHPMDGFDHDELRREFKIPDNFWCPLLLAVGHFDHSKKLVSGKWRKSFEEIVVAFD